jgi:CRISPR-associated endonuclease/helicase Cas3
MRLIRSIDTKPGADENASEEPMTHRHWQWYARASAADDDLSKTATRPIRWDHHTQDVLGKIERIARALNLPSELQHALSLAARFHDLGKKRQVWQRSIGNPNPTDWHAKSGKEPVSGKLWKPRDICPDYRHEFGSLLDVQSEEEFAALRNDMKDLVLHLIAVHHGRGRPHFPSDEVFDPEAKGKDLTRTAAEVTRRFARLQRKYGRWGLAYLESLLRSADYAASANPSQTEAQT